MAGSARRRFNHRINRRNTEPHALGDSDRTHLQPARRAGADPGRVAGNGLSQDLFDDRGHRYRRKELGAEQVAELAEFNISVIPTSGVAAARNRGAEIATGDLLLFVDDDTVVDESNLRRHEAIQREDERYVVCRSSELDLSRAGTLGSHSARSVPTRYEDRYNKPYEARAWSRRSCLPPDAGGSRSQHPSRGFAFLGGFDERFPVGAEDQDLTWRARQAGFTPHLRL